jgi:crotonobetainyl-CoA:carnitine CoA-transferase CaiB-like acyl-CoA transferase
MGGRPALEGTTVLELSSGIAGAYCGRLLAMLGADVIKVESPTRPDEARAAGTGGDRFLHAQKRSLALDTDAPTGAALLDRLVADADVVLDDGALGAPPAVRGRHDELLAAHPRLIIASFSTYGLDGPRADWLSTELTELAAGGFLAVGPHGGPAIMPGPPSGRCAVGTVGALGVVLALTARRRDGTGQLVEVSAQEALIHMLTLPTVVYSFGGVEMPRLGDGYPFGIYPCADGYLGVHILTQGHWTGLCQLMGRDDLVDHARYRTGVERADPTVAGELDAIIADWVRDQPADATFHAAQALRCAITIVPAPLAVLASEQYAARDFWVTDEVDGDPRRLPGVPFKLASGAFAPFRPATTIAAAEVAP